MIKPKAPKDMTATEFVALFESRYPGNEIYRSVLKKILAEPAPNPFTPDQIAWMRVEQRTGMTHAWHDRSGYVFCCTGEPLMDNDGDLRSLSECHSAHRNNFIKDFIPPNEFICFADYAPLEGENS